MTSLRPRPLPAARLLLAALGGATALAGAGRLHAQAASAAPITLSTVPTAANPALPLPDGLRPQVDFWKMIYSRVSKQQVVLHDRERMDVVYGVFDLAEAETPAAKVFNRNFLEARRSQLQAVLRSLGQGFLADTLSGEARRVYSLWIGPVGAKPTPGTFAGAVENVRWQRGLRERFIEGLAFSGRYQPHVEQVFREEGVPLELTFLPFVESMYNLRAYSSVGAAGVWQFMPGTGRLFMRVDGTVDERMDPIRAARAAARLLRQNYESLGTWPLALTAYNHGPYGMKNAVRNMGTRDIETIVNGYDGKAFGFASRNFYTEFLAALEVRRNYHEHLGDVRLDPPLEFEEVVLPVVARLSTIAELLALPVEALWDMNPAFTPNARRADRPIAAGHRLRVPSGSGERWGETLALLREHPDAKLAAGSAGRAAGPRAATYVVRRGDTLGGIAQRHGLTVSQLQRLNGFGGRTVIHPGQKLKVGR